VARLIVSSGDRETLVDFARQKLGSLLSRGDFERVLLETLRAYVEGGFNQRTAAHLAFLHPNTVAYRLRKIEQRLGVSLEDPTLRLELTLAMQIAVLSDLV
jgi:DNA-binding PucR family transcriptional regulator